MNKPVPFGPCDEPMVTDQFTYYEVKEGECEAVLLKNVKRYLNRTAKNKDFKYLGICLPCYNEDLYELIKTFLSLLENVEFMKKARMYEDGIGNSMTDEFRNLVPVIVPIFDGVNALSPTMRGWLGKNFEGIFDGLEDEEEAGFDPVVTLHDPEQSPYGKSWEPDLEKPEPADVKCCCKKFWYTFNEHASSDLAGTEESQLIEEAQQNIMEFFICPYVKRKNHRKHNSHQWFFKSFCSALDDSMDYTFLTDCGTTYEPNCVSKMMQEMYFNNDLIAVTARQRVELPNEWFHPCQNASFEWMVGDHSKCQKPCWKCYLTYAFSPICLQGWEYEFSQIMSYTMFNITETLPVMPGPCQMLDWQKVKLFDVIDDYFDLLMRGEAPTKLPRKLPPSFLPMDMRNLTPATEHLPRDTPTEIAGPGLASGGVQMAAPPSSKQSTSSRSPMSTSKSGKSTGSNPNPKPTRRARKKIETLTFVEFLRVNMRLAEDRILSFTSVFSTGYGTKWVPEATFYYTPEVRWDTLLTQRRRWMNGTFAAFFFYFNSPRARTRVYQGMFDTHKMGRNLFLVDMLWSLQLFQSCQVLVAPALFGTLSYIGIQYCEGYFPDYFFWASIRLLPQLGGGLSCTTLWLAVFICTYVVWVFQSYYSPKGKMSELYCVLLACYGCLFVMPFYAATVYVCMYMSLTLIQYLYLFTVFFPALIALVQEPISVVYYLGMTPWFMANVMFFLVYLPAYSFSRLYDTTWGNRATGADSALSNSGVEVMMKWNFYFIVALVCTNLGLMFGLIQLIKLGFDVKISFMFFIVFPTVIELFLSASVAFIVVPARAFIDRLTLPLRDLDREIPDEQSTVCDNQSLSSQGAPKAYAGKTTSRLPTITQELMQQYSASENGLGNLSSVSECSDYHQINLKASRLGEKDKMFLSTSKANKV